MKAAQEIPSLVELIKSISIKFKLAATLLNKNADLEANKYAKLAMPDHQKLNKLAEARTITNINVLQAIKLHYIPSIKEMIKAFRSANFYEQIIALIQISISTLVNVLKNWYCMIGNELTSLLDKECILTIINFHYILSQFFVELTDFKESVYYLKISYKTITNFMRSGDTSTLNQAKDIHYKIQASYYPTLIRYYISKNKIKKAIEYEALAYRLYLGDAPILNKAFIIQHMYRCYLFIADHYNDKGEFIESIDWYESTIEMLESTISLYKSNPKIAYKEINGKKQQFFSTEQKIKDYNKEILSINKKIKLSYQNIKQKNYNQLLNNLPSKIIIKASFDFDKGIGKFFFATPSLKKIFVSCATTAFFEVIEGIQSAQIDFNNINTDNIKIFSSKIKKDLESQSFNIKNKKNNISVNNILTQTSTTSSVCLPSFNDAKELKEGKLKRHEENERARFRAKENIMEVLKIKQKKLKEIKIIWDDNTDEIDNPDNYYQADSQSMLFFSKFSENLFDAKVPSTTKDKFKLTAARGRVLGNHTHNTQGYCILGDRTIKLKILGRKGNGNHRILGNSIRNGKFFKIYTDGHIEQKPCQLIEFNQYVHKAHKK